MRPHVKEAVAAGLALFAALCVLGYCQGCGPREQAATVQGIENAAAVAQYTKLLDDCKAKGKDAGSYAVYDACADEVDRMICRASGAQCVDGGR